MVWLKVVGSRVATIAVPVWLLPVPLHVTVVVPMPVKPRPQAVPRSSVPSGRTVNDVNGELEVQVMLSPLAVSSASAPTSDQPVTRAPEASVTRTSLRVAVEVVPLACWLSAGRTAGSMPV